MLVTFLASAFGNEAAEAGSVWAAAAARVAARAAAVQRQRPQRLQRHEQQQQQQQQRQQPQQPQQHPMDANSSGLQLDAYIISGERGNASTVHERRYTSAIRTCALLVGRERCHRSEAVFLTTNGKGRCGARGDSLTGESRGVVGLHLAHRDVWSMIAARTGTWASGIDQMPVLVFEDDAALPSLLNGTNARQLVKRALWGGGATHSPPAAGFHTLPPQTPRTARGVAAELTWLGYWAHTCTHAYALTPAGARRLLEHDAQLCDPRWPVDAAMHQLGCRRGHYGGAMRCAYALPNVRNGPDTRYDGIVKQRKSLFEREKWSFRRR